MNFNPYPYGESTENYENYDTYQKSYRENPEVSPANIYGKHVIQLINNIDIQIRGFNQIPGWKCLNVDFPIIVIFELYMFTI